MGKNNNLKTICGFTKARKYLENPEVETIINKMFSIRPVSNEEFSQLEKNPPVTDSSELVAIIFDRKEIYSHITYEKYHNFKTALSRWLLKNDEWYATFLSKEETTMIIKLDALEDISERIKLTLAAQLMKKYLAQQQVIDSPASHVEHLQAQPIAQPIVSEATQNSMLQSQDLSVHRFWQQLRQQNHNYPANHRRFVSHQNKSLLKWDGTNASHLFFETPVYDAVATPFVNTELITAASLGGEFTEQRELVNPFDGLDYKSLLKYEAEKLLPYTLSCYFDRLQKIEPNYFYCVSKEIQNVNESTVTYRFLQSAFKNEQDFGAFIDTFAEWCKDNFLICNLIDRSIEGIDLAITLDSQKLYSMEDMCIGVQRQLMLALHQCIQNDKLYPHDEFMKNDVSGFLNVDDDANNDIEADASHRSKRTKW